MNSSIRSKSTRQRGTALAIVLVLITLLTVAGNLVLRQMRVNFLISNQLNRRFQLEHLAIGGLHQIVNMLREHQLSLDFQFHEIVPGRCVARQQQSGLYTDILVLAFEREDTVRVNGILGHSADKLFPAALMIVGQSPRLVISQGTIIDGDVLLNHGDISYSPPFVARHEPILGRINLHNEFQDTLLNIERLEGIFSSFSTILENSSFTYPMLSDGSYSVSDLADYDRVYVDGDLELFGNRADTLYLEELCVKYNLKLGGQVVIAPGSRMIVGNNVFISDSTTALGVTVHAGRGIYFQDFSETEGQFLADQQISVTGNSNVKFPSLLCVPVNWEKVLGEPEIVIGDAATFQGCVFLYDHENDQYFSRQRLFQGKIRVGPTATFSGGIVSEGVAEFYGSVAGFVYCHNIEQMDKRTRWTNYLQDTQLLRSRISPRYPLPPIFSELTNLEILEMEILW